MTTTFNRYIIAVPHQRPAHILADDQYGEGLVSKALELQEYLNDLAHYVIIDSEDDERLELSRGDAHQQAAKIALINHQRQERFDCPIVLNGYRVVDGAAIPVIENGAPTGTLADLIAKSDFAGVEVGEPLAGHPENQAWPLYDPCVARRHSGNRRDHVV